LEIKERGSGKQLPLCFDFAPVPPGEDRKELFTVLVQVVTQGVAELVHAGGRLLAAGNAAETVQNEVDVHAFDHGGDGLKVSLTTTIEFDVVDAAVFHDEINFLGANAAAAFGEEVFHFGVSCGGGGHGGHIMLSIIHDFAVLWIKKFNRQCRSGYVLVPVRRVGICQVPAGHGRLLETTWKAFSDQKSMQTRGNQTVCNALVAMSSWWKERVPRIQISNRVCDVLYPIF